MHASTLGKAVVVAAMALVGVGCGPSWQVVKQANPNPFVGVKNFSLENVSYPQGGIQVGDKTEDAWLAEKKPEQVESYKKDKDDTANAIAKKLTENKSGLAFSQVPPGTPAAGDTFLVKPIITFLEPGIFTAVFNIATTVRMSAQVLDKSGTVVDEIAFTASQPADLYHPATGPRMVNCGEELGEQLVKYLQSRTTGAK